MNVFKNGLATGLLIQFAIGPVFFFLMNLTLQKTVWDGLIGVLAVTLADYFYIALALLGIGALLKKENIKKVFGVIGPVVLIIFGIIIIKGIFAEHTSHNSIINSKNLASSFISAFVLTILSPMTIVFWTGIFATKTMEYNYKKHELVIFGLSTGLATVLFLGCSVILIFLAKEAVTVPLLAVQTLNFIVGCLLLGYGGIRLKAVLPIWQN
jgi:threonine/homoserine/homoserine lactone efflux protein